MQVLVYVYYLLLIAAFCSSVLYLHVYRIRLIAAWLLLSILTETVVELLGSGQSKHYFLYHLFNFIEYPLVTLALRSYIRQNNIRRLMLLSMPVYALAVACIIRFFQSLNDYPSLSSNIESILVIVWCLVSFMTLEPDASVSIFKRSQFWITLAFFAYFSGTFCFNSIYNYLLSKETLTARNIFTIINSVFNYLLYIFILIGIPCHRSERKYSV